jgi:hypothetical protein
MSLISFQQLKSSPIYNQTGVRTSGYLSLSNYIFVQQVYVTNSLALGKLPALTLHSAGGDLSVIVGDWSVRDLN